MFLHVASAMRMADSRYEKARVPSTRKGTRAHRQNEVLRPDGLDHFVGAELLDGMAEPVDGVDGVDGIAEPEVAVGSVAGLLLSPHATARAASAERTMSFFMI